MKKIFYISIIALVAIISGCAKEENAETPTPQVKEPETHTVVFHAVDGTKTAINEGEKAKFVWTDGDVERLTITENYKVGIIDKDNFSLSTGDGLSNRILTFTASFPVPDPTPDNYVYTAVLASTDGDDNPIVPSEQTTSDGSSYDPYADILVGTYESSDPATELNLSFYRPVAVNKMTLKGLTAGEVVKTVKITSNNNKSLTGTYDIINNSWSENSSEIIINTSQEVPNDANNKGNVTVFFTTMPVDGASLTIDVITQTSTATFFYKKQFAENLTIDFSPNLVTRFGVNNLNMTPAVAEVITGEERIGYATIDAAFDAANASETDCTIKLLADCSVSNKLSLNDSGSGKITLDLNGKTLYGPTGTNTISITSKRNFTIDDSFSDSIDGQGSIIGDSEADNQTIYTLNSTINIKGGNIVSTANDRYSIYLSGKSSCNIENGKITSIYRGIYSDNNTELSIEGGVFNCQQQCLYNSGQNTNISGGTFHSEKSATITSYGSSSKCLITDGYFSNNNNSELFTIASSGKVYVTGGYSSKPVNSNRLRTDTNYLRCNSQNTNTSTMETYPYKLGNDLRWWKETVVGANNIPYYFNRINDAVNHSREASNDVTIQMQKPYNTIVSKEETGNLDFTNINKKNITLDLNGNLLTTSTVGFITTSGNLVITDSKETKGLLSSSSSKIVNLTNSGNITIESCIIKCTGTSSSYYTEAAILMNNASAELNINDALIYTTGSMTTISNISGTLTIGGDNGTTEISSGTETEGLVAVANGYSKNAKTIINSGSFWTSATNEKRPTVYTGSGAGQTTNIRATVEINGGYFYAENLPRDIRCSYKAYNSTITINGGYFLHSTVWDTNPTYGDKKEEIELNSPESHQHTTNSIGNLSYYYTIGQASAQQ